MGSLAERSIELHLRDDVRFGVGALDELPGMTAAADQAGPGGSARVFIVTDEGVRRSGVVDRVRAVLEAAGVEVGLFAGVEPNPGTTSIELGSAAFDGFGLGDTVVVPVGGGSAMDSAKVISLHAMNGGDILDLGYHRADLRPGRPLVAVPTTAGTGAETNSYGVVTDEVAGRKVYIGHPSVRPVGTILDPALTVGLPPAATAATGVDAMTHAIESLLSRNPNPFAEGLALQVIRTVSRWLPRAVADGADIEARSELLIASHLAGLGQASGTGVGLVHALGHAIGSRGRLAHGLALAVVLPEVLAFYAVPPGVRDQEMTLIGRAMGTASPPDATDATAETIDALRSFLDGIGLRPRLRELGFDAASLDVVAADAVADPAILNAPWIPSVTEARAILEAVL